MLSPRANCSWWVCANPEIDHLIDAIRTELVTFGRDGVIEKVWKMVRADIVYVPLHQQVTV